MNNDYLDYLAHYRTPGAVNGVSHTPGYDAVGKPAMSEAERRARRKADRLERKERRWKKRMDKADAKANSREARGKSGVKAYGSAMFWNGGQPLINGMKRYGYAKRLYDHLAETRGTEYADKVVKNAKKKAVLNLAAQETIFIGAMAASAILANKGYTPYFVVKNG